MKTFWNETSIRSELARLDKRTGLKGAELPISFNNARCTLGLYDSTDGGSFKFSNYFFQDPDWPVESALDVIRHEYAHHMDHVLYGHGGHGATWKLCCGIVGASPIRYYYKRKHLEESKISEHYDTYNIGVKIDHPKYGVGVIEEIFGSGTCRCISVRFQSYDCKKLGLRWVDSNCRRIG